jgi:hypothetical protein
LPRAIRKKPLFPVAGPPHLVCDVLNIRDDDLRDAINSGAVPVYRLGLRRRVVIEDAVKWLRTNPQVRGRKNA